MSDPGYTEEEQNGRMYYRSKFNSAFVTPHLSKMERHVLFHQEQQDSEPIPYWFNDQSSGDEEE